MSQHPSLLGSQKGKQHRSVLKRYEKLKTLVEKEKWKEDDSVYSLPKIKSIKFKVKKEKVAAVEGEAVAAVPGAAATTPQAPAAGGKPQAKPAAAKPVAGKPAAEQAASQKDKKAKA